MKPDDGDGLDTAALRDNVIEVLAERYYTRFRRETWDDEGTWSRETDAYKQGWRDEAASDLDAALAVTACTTCGGDGVIYMPSAREPHDVPEPCPVCHGTPPRALRWANATDGPMSPSNTARVIQDLRAAMGESTERNEQEG